MSEDIKSQVRLLAQRIGERVRSLRVRQGLSQAALAERAEVTPESVARLERTGRSQTAGNTNPGLFLLTSISIALDVDICALMCPHHPTVSTGSQEYALLESASPMVRERLLAIARAMILEEAGQSRTAKSELPIG